MAPRESSPRRITKPELVRIVLSSSQPATGAVLGRPPRLGSRTGASDRAITSSRKARTGGSFGRSSKPSVRFVARRASDDEQVSLDLSLDENSFKVGDGIQSGGVFKEGRGFSFGPLGMQFVSGKTKLTAAGMKEGDKVEGEFEGDIMKLIGMGR